MSKLSFFFLPFSFLILFSCTSTKQIAQSPPQGEEIMTLPDLHSYININYKIKKNGITDTFNTVMDTIFKTPFYNAENDITTKLKRIGDVQVDIQNKSFLILLPIDVEVEKKTFIKDFKAKGSLELSIVSDLSINKNWQLSTVTKLVDHTWTKKPKLELGIFNLPIETLSNIILKRIKREIEFNIDQSIKASYDLPAIMKQVAAYTFVPFELDSVYGGWMQMVPDSTYMSSVKNTTFYSEGKISITSKMNLTSIKPSAYNNNVLPPFSWKENIKDSSLVKLILELRYDHLATIAKDKFIGQTFEEGDKKIEVLDVNIDKKDGKLQVATKVKGSLNGEISVTGIPRYNSTTGILYLTDTHVSLKTGNILHKAGVWLLQGKIRKELEKMTQFPLAEQFKTAQNQVDDQVKLMNKKYKFDLKVSLGSINIEQMILRPDRINAYIGMKMRFDTKLDNLYFFQD